MTVTTARDRLPSTAGETSRRDRSDGRSAGSMGDVPLSHLSVLNGFQLRSDHRVVTLPMSAQRLLALLALHRRPLVRLHAAAVLWPDTPEKNARADLRTALWKVHRPGAALVCAEGGQLWLRPEVTVDLHQLLGLTRRLSQTAEEAIDEEHDLTLLRSDLLPDWYDEWVITERERVRQLRLHALEMVCERLTVARSFGAAIDAGLAAVATEPLRESAHYLLIRAYLAEGNRYEAVRQFCRHRDQLRDELGVRPSSKLEALVAGFTIR